MKRLGLITAILVVIVAGEFWGLTWTKNYTSELSAQLTDLSRQTDQEILPELEEIRVEWDDRRRVMSLFLHEQSLDDFEKALTGAELRVGAGEKDAAVWLQTAADAAKGIWESERPTLQNVL